MQKISTGEDSPRKKMILHKSEQLVLKLIIEDGNALSVYNFGWKRFAVRFCYIYACIGSLRLNYYKYVTV